MSKFAALAANVADTFRVELIDPISDDVLRDRDGKPAYIDVLSADSEIGRAFDAEARQRAFRAARKSRTGMPDDIDQLAENQRKLARLTKGWHLVDPHSRDVLPVPFTEKDAGDLYAEPGLNWLFTQVWAAAANPANFMKRNSTSFSLGPSASSGTLAG